jgi:hypothetical protein
LRVWVVTDDYFTNSMRGVFAWDGTAWAEVGSLEGPGRVMAVYDEGSGEALFVGGNFVSIDGTLIRYVARWDGASWSQVGGGVPSDVDALTVWDDGTGPVLHAAVGGRVMRWDGSAWSTMDGTFSGWLNLNGENPLLMDLHVHDDGNGETLYAAGNFAAVSGSNAAGVARWNGAGWEALGGAPDKQVAALETFDAGDGRGPRLAAVGGFESIGGVAAKRVALWDGTTWEPLGPGFSAPADGVASFDDGSGAWPALWAVGKFKTAGGNPSEHVARWDNPCAGQGTSYCTAGTTSNGCTALISSTGFASHSAASGFDVSVAGGEGNAPGLIFFGTDGAQANPPNPWGNGSSFICVVPPFTRTGLQQGVGTPGLCDGAFGLDFNAWMDLNPAKAPPGGASVAMQCWFRDPQNTSNQGTSLSDGLRFAVLP